MEEMKEHSITQIPKDWPQAEALFRYQMIAPLLDTLSSPAEKRDWRKYVTSREHTLPNGKQKKISERTLRLWVPNIEIILSKD